MSLVSSLRPYGYYNILLKEPTVWLKNNGWTISNNTITGWNDASGLLNPTQTDDARKPLIHTNAINGYPSLSFQNQYFLTNYITLKKAYSVMLLDNVWQIINFDITSTFNNMYPMGRGIVISSIYGAGIAGTYPDYYGTSRYVDVRDKVQGWVNGGSTSFGATNGNFGDPATNTAKVFRGGYWLKPNEYINWAVSENETVSFSPFLACEIAEVILYNSELTERENESVIKYLKGKYHL